MSDEKNELDLEKLEKIRKEIQEHRADPLKPLFEILRKEQERQDADKAQRNPPQRQSVVLGKLGYALLLVALVGVSIGGYKYFKYQRASALREALEKQNISQMVARYDARTAWREKLESLDEASITDVQELLLIRDHHPLSLSVYIRKFSGPNDNSAHFAEFGSPDPEIDFILECSAEQIAKLRQSFSTDDGTEYAVIATVASVERPEASENNSDETPFVAKGRCLDFLVVNY
jgi:hypothetical protein